MSVVNINQNNVHLIKNSDKPVLIDFYADWCGPCRLMSPIIDMLALENPQYLVAKVNVENEPELANEFGVSSIPLLVVMKDGKVIKQSAGAKPKQKILEMLEG